MRDAIQINLSEKAAKDMIRRFVAVGEGPHWFVLKKCRGHRTLSQNAYFHAVIVPAMWRLARDHGNELDLDGAKSVLKDKFLKVPVLNKNTGQMLGERVRGTSELEVDEFSELIEKCIAFLEEEGEHVPHPGIYYQPSRTDAVKDRDARYARHEAGRRGLGKQEIES